MDPRPTAEATAGATAGAAPGQPPAQPPAQPRTATTAPDAAVGAATEPLARLAAQGLVALLVGLQLVLPLRGAIGSDTYGGYYGWVGIGIAVTVVVGLVARLVLAVPHALAVAATAAAVYLFCCPILLWLLAGLEDPGSDGEVALIVGTTSAALATLVVVGVAARVGEALAVVALISCVVGFGFGVSAGEPAWSAVRDAQEAAERAAEIEESGLSAYLPEIEGMDPEFSTISRTDGVVTGVSLAYSRSGEMFASTLLYVDITGAQECDPELYECEQGDGYVVVSRDGEVDSIIATVDGQGLVATYSSSGSGAIAPDEVGAALAGAEESDWVTIAGLG
ncbi:hypothetical protein [Nocardioides sambongensis]|uniref:hypothetical protein n=1 Tax=Nocardioides sambongensis TaxID=2589074 RepID=UPI00112E87EC|nr:hypothetical protein [Nocardioides sambongensis]